MADMAQLIKDGLAAGPVDWPPQATSGVTPTLHVDDNYRPSDAGPQILVADDGGPREWITDYWSTGGRGHPRGYWRRPLLRLTAFAAGRSTAREVVMTGADWVCAHKSDVGIIRVEDVSDPLLTRDRVTGAYLASVTMPVIVSAA